jgi:hypothetical protein
MSANKKFALVKSVQHSRQRPGLGDVAEFEKPSSWELLLSKYTKV